MPFSKRSESLPDTATGFSSPSSKELGSSFCGGVTAGSSAGASLSGVDVSVVSGVLLEELQPAANRSNASVPASFILVTARFFFDCTESCYLSPFRFDKPYATFREIALKRRFP